MLVTSLFAAVLLSTELPAGALEGYASVLSVQVKEGRVAYAALRDDRLAPLDAFLKAVAKATPPADKSAALAFYIDSYNALVLRAVVTEGRPRSVLDVKGFFDGKIYEVAGKKVTLNQLEKEIILPLAKPDPRPHMVLVCGAVGCPVLEREPYSGSDLDARLSAATRRYLAGPRGAQIEDGKIKLSKIFDWYQADFGGPAGVLTFVKKHLSPEALKRIGDAPKVEFIDYNWTLNQQ
ncbi:MAG: DUF547 domain-containing protein [Deltaproteobacteria bacterium]|nr:DUF547 domain-containing protein [Deltaproteobacteria bacterium]